MYCPKCGVENPDNSKFCNDCGTNFTEFFTVKEEKPEPPVETTVEVMDTDSQNNETTKRNNKISKIVLICAAIISFILLALLIEIDADAGPTLFFLVFGIVCVFMAVRLHRGKSSINDIQHKFTSYDDITHNPYEKSSQINSLEQKQIQLDIKKTKMEIKDLKKQARCPRCGSTSLSGNKKGYGIGKGVIGASFVGPIGLVAGNLGAKKVRVTCMKCGKQYMA